MNGHAELHTYFDRTPVHDFRAERRHPQHLIVADGVKLAGVRHQARIGRVNAVHVGVNLARLGSQRRRQGNRRGVAAAAPQRGDVHIIGDALKAGHDHDPAAVEHLADAGGIDRADAGFGVRTVRQQPDLGTGHADGLIAGFVNRHRH